MRWRLANVAVLSALLVAGRVCADDAKWTELEAALKELQGCETEVRLHDAAIEACREGMARRLGGEMAAKRLAVEQADKDVARAQTEGGLGALRDTLEKARKARDGKVESLLKDVPEFLDAQRRQAEVAKKIADMEGRVDSLKAGEVLELARLKAEQHDLGRSLSGAVRAWWRRGEVAAEYKAADEAYSALGAETGKAAGLKEAEGNLRAARKALSEAMAALTPETPAAKELAARRAEWSTKTTDLKAKIAELEKTLVAGTTVSVTVKSFDRKANKEVDKKVSLWLPSGHESIRGVIVAHPMVSGLASAAPIRREAARAGLGMMVYDGFGGDGRESLARLDDLFEKFGAESKHPELKGAPVMVGGLSASVLATRNVACAVPERVFGVVHVAGGNMQEMPDGGRGMVQVPFLAHNGEFEWCGPVGGGHASGKFGIRPEYGNQTQWVMIREQMLRLWRGRHEHRMSLVVVPNADHGAWDVGLTALFVRKAAQYRIPDGKRDGSKPAVCAPLPVEKGWLSDADLDHPRHEPAPYSAYKGDKDNAFWHFDEEMARAVVGYHKGRFLLPDPTKKNPVPADWPPTGK